MAEIPETAFFPIHLICQRIFELKEGEFAYAEPEALWVDSNYRCWLFGDFATYTLQTVDHKNNNLILLERGSDGITVTVNPDSKFRWSIQETLDALDDDDMDEEHEEMKGFDMPIQTIVCDRAAWKKPLLSFN